MNKINLLKGFTAAGKVACLAVLIFSSCSSIKNTKYFNDIPDDRLNTVLENVPYVEPTIRPDDILSINIQTADPAATQVLSMGNTSNSALGTSSTGIGGAQISGYLVDSKGNIELPVIGPVKVGGLTTEQAKEAIKAKTSVYFKNPTVNLRFSNFKITVLGEVTKPGTYVVSNEKINILDALGLAGDLTVYGKRENVALVRQNVDGSREFVRLDLTKSNVLNSPYYYLRQNDYIYVEPGKAKIVSSDAIQNRNVGIITAVATSLLSVLTILISTNKI